MARHRIVLSAAGLLVWLATAACTDPTEAADNSDIPADPGSAPPSAAPTTGNYVPSSLSVDNPSSKNPNRIRLTVGGTNGGVTYGPDNLIVVEDGVVKGIKISSGASAALKTDIAVLIDNTGSMSSGISSVKNSVLAFVNALRASGQNVQLGVVAFNDDFANDGNATYNVSASDVIGDAAVYGFRPLTSDLTETGTVYKFVAALPATGGGDSPELAFSAIDFARRTFDWRPGAQRVYIVITDITSWGKNAPAGLSKGISGSYPWTDVTLGEQLRLDGSVVHCICPNTKTVFTGEYNVKTLATATGGVWTLYTTSAFDLTALPILSVTEATRLVEFLRTSSGPGEHTLRVVVQQSPSQRGERTIIVNY